MAGPVRTSALGLQLIKSFEGFRESATQLPGGRWTIGYGHVRTAREGLTISEKDAEDLLVYDLKPVEDAISTLVFAPLLQNQFDALVSLAFNISVAQFRNSDILQNLNSGDYLAAANGFDVWRRARLNGRVIVVDALVRRRAAEKSMFLDHPSGPTAAPTPLVKPEMDVSEGSARMSYPHAKDEDAESAPSQVRTPSQGGSVDIAEAVRRLAERTREAISPTPEIPLPPGTVVTPPENVRREIPPQVETHATSREAPAEPPVDQRVRTPEELDVAGRNIAERVKSILKRAEETLDAPGSEPVAASQKTQQRAEPEVTHRPAANENVR